MSAVPGEYLDPPGMAIRARGQSGDYAQQPYNVWLDNVILMAQ